MTTSTIYTINVGPQPNDGSGDVLRDAFKKINANFETLFTQLNAIDFSTIGAVVSQLAVLDKLTIPGISVVAPVAGGLRYNALSSKVEVYNGSNWIPASLSRYVPYYFTASPGTNLFTVGIYTPGTNSTRLIIDGITYPESEYIEVDRTTVQVNNMIGGENIIIEVIDSFSSVSTTDVLVSLRSTSVTNTIPSTGYINFNPSFVLMQDLGGNYNASSNTVTVPITGYYEVTMGGGLVNFTSNQIEFGVIIDGNLTSTATVYGSNIIHFTTATSNNSIQMYCPPIPITNSSTIQVVYKTGDSFSLGGTTMQPLDLTFRRVS